jgi:hypothetical protein
MLSRKSGGKLPPLSGWLQRTESNIFSLWKKRFFKLEGDKLYWYNTSLDLEHLGFIELRDIVSVEQRDQRKSPNQIEVRLRTKALYLYCLNEEEVKYWIDGLKRWVAFFNEDWKNVHDQSEANGLVLSSSLPSPSVKESILKSNFPPLSHNSSDIIESNKLSSNSLSTSSEIQTEPNSLKASSNGQDDQIFNLSFKEDHMQKVYTNHLNIIPESNLEESNLLSESIKDKNSESQTDNLSVSNIISEKSIVEIESSQKNVGILSDPSKQQVDILEDKEIQWKEQLRQKDLELQKERENVTLLKKEINEKNQQISNLQLKINELETESQRETENIKQRYFFSLALNIKMNSNQMEMNVNDLYTQVRSTNLPVETWAKWILETTKLPTDQTT